MGSLHSAISKELAGIIEQITDELIDREVGVRGELHELQRRNEQTIEALGKIVELKIRKREIKYLRVFISEVLKGSTNKLILSTREPADN